MRFSMRNRGPTNEPTLAFMGFDSISGFFVVLPCITCQHWLNRRDTPSNSRPNETDVRSPDGTAIALPKAQSLLAHNLRPLILTILGAV